MSKETRRIQIVLFFIVSILFFLSMSVYKAFLTPYGQELGFSATQIGLILGAAGTISMLARFPIGVVAQLFPKRRMVMQIGLLINAIPWFIAFLYPQFRVMWFAKGCEGLMAATWVMYTVLYSTYFTEEEIPQSIGVINLASSIGPVLGSNIGGLISSFLGYRYTIITAVGCGVLAFILIFFLKEPDSAPASTVKETVVICKNQVLDLNVWRIGLMATLPMMATYAYMDYITPVVVQDLGGAAGAITMCNNCFRFSCMAASPLVGYFFYKHLGVVKTIATGAIALGIVCLLMPYSPNLIVVYILHVGIGFFFTMNFTMLLSLIIMGVPKETQSTRMGLLQSIYSIGLAFGPMLSGILNDYLPTTQVAWVMGGAVLVVAVFTKLLAPKSLIQALDESKKAEGIQA